MGPKTDLQTLIDIRLEFRSTSYQEMDEVIQQKRIEAGVGADLYDFEYHHALASDLIKAGDEEKAIQHAEQVGQFINSRSPQ